MSYSTVDLPLLVPTGLNRHTIFLHPIYSKLEGLTEGSNNPCQNPSHLNKYDRGEQPLVWPLSTVSLRCHQGAKSSNLHLLGIYLCIKEWLDH